MDKIISLEISEIEAVNGAGDCELYVAATITTAVTTAGAILTAPLTFGASLAVAALGGTSTGISLGQAVEACSAD